MPFVVLERASMGYRFANLPSLPLLFVRAIVLTLPTSAVASDACISALAAEAGRGDVLSPRAIIKGRLEPRLAQAGIHPTGQEPDDRGGHAYVFFGVTAGGEDCAVKTPWLDLRYTGPQLTLEATPSQPYVDLLKQEGRTLESLGPHPNVIGVLDSRYLDDEAYPFLVLQHGGPSLGHVIERERRFEILRKYWIIPPSKRQLAEMRAKRIEALSLAEGILSGLKHVHAHGTVHGDIKPQNIVVGTDGTARLIDFGMSRKSGAPYPGPRQDSHASENQRKPDARATFQDDLDSLALILRQIGVGEPELEQPGQLSSADEFLRAVGKKKKALAAD